jgi:outer membrane protein OmpA-like peptidoglycan-associated protein
MNTKNKLNLQPSWITKSLYSSILAIIALQTGPIVQAEDVKMYSSVPCAKEMANLLFPETSTRPKTRSISFDPAENSSTPVAQSVGVGLPIQFAFNSDEITSDSRPYIDELGQMLLLKALRDKKVVIEGHTDAIGPQQYNQQLSVKRARAVKQYLFNNYGIDGNRLVISGKGEYAPLSGQDPSSAINRRVEIHKYQPQ